MELDPWLFGPDAIDPDTAEFNRRLKAASREAPNITTVPVAELRTARERGESIFGPFRVSDRSVERQIPGPEGTVGVRQIVPLSEPRAVLLHLHGGGWVLGSPREQDARHVALADRQGIAVVSVDYRLAPEHPYPAAPDDCEAAARWLVDHCEREFGTDRLLIGGESAGAHLAVVTLLRLRDRHGFSGFRAANLAYGVFDLALTPSAANWGDEPLILSTETMQWFQEAFVDRALTRDPDVSPLFADLRDLPPALFTIGTLDPLLDDSLFMAQRWIAAGNRAELAVYPGGVHAFDYFPDLPLGQAAVAKITEFLSDAV